MPKVDNEIDVANSESIFYIEWKNKKTGQVKRTKSPMNKESAERFVNASNVPNSASIYRVVTSTTIPWQNDKKDNATNKIEAPTPKHITIENRLAVVQVCNEDFANVFVHLNDRLYYVRIDRLRKKVEFKGRENAEHREAEKFVEDNFEQFDQFCSTLSMNKAIAGQPSSVINRTVI